MTAPDHFAEANLTSFAGGGSSTYDFCNEAREFDRRITGNPSHGMNRKEPASCMQVGCPCRSRLGVGNAALRRLSDGVPKIAVMNESTVFADDSVKHMLPAFKQQWNKDLA